MGQSGYRPLQNDTAIDWLEEFSGSPSAKAMTRALRQATRPRSDDDDESEGLAAAALIVAAWDGKYPRGLNAGVKAWLAALPEKQLQTWAPSVVKLVKTLSKRSMLRDLWAESPHCEAWEKELHSLVVRLDHPVVARRVAKSQAKARAVPERCKGDVFRLALPNGEFAWGRVYGARQVGIYNFFSRDKEAPAPIGLRDFFHFFRLHGDQFRSRKLELVGQDPFASGEADCQPMFGGRFPGHFLIQPLEDSSREVLRRVPTDEVVGLGCNCHSMIANVCNALANRDMATGLWSYWPTLPNVEIEGPRVLAFSTWRHQPWSAWPAVRERLLMELGPDFEEILRARMCDIRYMAS